MTKNEKAKDANETAGERNQSNPSNKKKIRKIVFVLIPALCAVCIALAVIYLTRGVADNNNGTVPAGDTSKIIQTLSEADSKIMQSAGLNDGSLVSSTVYDTDTGLPVADIIAPEGWTVTAEMDWKTSQSITPILANIVAKSPDESATFTFSTDRSYIQDVNGSNSTKDNVKDDSNNLTYLKSRNADEMLDYLVNQEYASYQGKNNIDISEAYLELFGSKANEKIERDSSSAVDNIEQMGLAATMDSSFYSVSEKNYSVTADNGSSLFIDRSVSVIGYQITMTGTGSSSSVIYWEAPFSAELRTDSEETYNEYYSLYKLFLNNVKIRSEFVYVRNEYSNYINQMAEEKTTDSVQEAKDMIADYLEKYNNSDKGETKPEFWAEGYYS